MAVSDVSICNMALDLVGADPIISLLDNTTPGKLASRNYEPTRNKLLRAYPWNFALRRARLVAADTPPAFGYLRQFRLPEGPEQEGPPAVPARCLRVFEINGERRFSLTYKVEGRFMLTDLPGPLAIRYIALIEDPAQFDALFLEVLAGELAVKFAPRLTESASRRRELREDLEDLRRQARAIDAQEGTPEAFGPEPTTDDDFSWLESRR